MVTQIQAALRAAIPHAQVSPMPDGTYYLSLECAPVGAK